MKAKKVTKARKKVRAKAKTRPEPVVVSGAHSFNQMIDEAIQTARNTPPTPQAPDEIKETEELVKQFLAGGGMVVRIPTK